MANFNFILLSKLSMFFGLVRIVSLDVCLVQHSLYLFLTFYNVSLFQLQIALLFFLLLLKSHCLSVKTMIKISISSDLIIIQQSGFDVTAISLVKHKWTIKLYVKTYWKLMDTLSYINSIFFLFYENLNLEWLRFLQVSV